MADVLGWENATGKMFFHKADAMLDGLGRWVLLYNLTLEH